MSERWASRTAWALLLLAVLVSLGVAVARLRTERADRYVEVVVDGWDAQDRAKQLGVSYVQFLRTLKHNGATAVAIAERDLTSVQAAGSATVATGAELRRRAAEGTVSQAVMEQLVHGVIMDGYTYVQTSRADLGATLVARLGMEHVHELAPGLWEIAYSHDRVVQITLGFDAADFQAVREAGLRPVPRPADYPGITAEQVAETFATLDRLAPESRAIIFQGNEVLGFPAALQATADAIRSRQWVLGLVEKAQGAGYIVQQGQERLAALVGYRVARVSSRLSSGTRILYVRPGTDAVADVRRAAGAVEAAGFSPGIPGGFAYVHTGRLLQVILSLGLAGAALLLLQHQYRVGGWALGVWSLGLAAGAILWPYALPTAAGWVGLGAAVVLPALGVTVLVARVQDPAAGAFGSVSVVVWCLLAGLGGAILNRAVGNVPTLLLGMARVPPAWLAPGLVFALAGGGYAWAQRRRFSWDARVTTAHLAAAAAVLLAGAVTVRYPGWAAVLVGGAALMDLPGPVRVVGLASGLFGAVALSLSPGGHAWAGVAGVVLGVVIQLFRTFKSAAASAHAELAGEGRPHHG